MAKLLATIKAVITRIIFAAHAFIAIWQVTQYKKDIIYWCLCAPMGLLFFEGIFTLAIKKNQEWRWFCPSVFLYLGSVVPAIWLIELNKVERRLQIVQIKEETISLTAAAGANLKNLDKLLGVKFNLPTINVDAETWVTLIEQFLMLVLIIGRWMLPKGDLTRDQLSQLLLVYIGTAADIIEFFDSFKDNTIAKEPLLVWLTLGIWSWSLMQFTIVLSATRSRKPRGGGSNAADADGNCCNGCCCSIDVWGIALNIILQDAPFLAFRMLIIIHYRIISYMNVFFTCKNTLVIMLQLYRLYVLQSENKKSNKTGKGNRKKRANDGELTDVYVISSGKHNRKRGKRVADDSDDEYETQKKKSKSKHKSGKKDTGYSTASSTSISSSSKENDRKSKKSKKKARKCDDSESSDDEKSKRKAKKSKSSKSKKERRREKEIQEVTENSDDSITSSEEEPQKHRGSKGKSKKKHKRDTSDSD